MPKTLTVTMQITVGDYLADGRTELVDTRLWNALDFNTEEPDYDITVDSIEINEN